MALLLSATGLLTKAESTAYVQFPAGEKHLKMRTAEEDGWPDYKARDE